MGIPFMDLAAAHRPLKAEIMQAVSAALDRAAFVGGEQVASFEREYADYIGSAHCIGVGSGTDALRLALLAAGIKAGDDVITSPHTFIATAEAISQCGARPVFVDIDPLTFALDAAQIEAAITPRTRAIVPVHLYGQPADMDAIIEVAARFDLILIEDACQAHGATYRSKVVGSIGQAGCFSFYPGKNLGACGEAGAVVTDDKQLAERVRILRDHGQPRKYMHTLEGYNARLDAIQAATLRIKLRQLPAWTAARQNIAIQYQEGLARADGLQIPKTTDGCSSVWHLFVVLHEKRDQLRDGLEAVGVGVGLHYPVPLHLQPAYAGLGYAPGAFPQAERAARQCLSLPIYPELDPQQINTVITAVIKQCAVLGKSRTAPKKAA